jgi:hypothetical protein
MEKSAIPEPSEAQKDLWVPKNDEERTSVREQLDRLVASPMFKNSIRCATLLRYLVERILNGHVEHIKERTIGIEAFGREANYDTAEDPVVRNTAVAVRRRLAQYYENPRLEDKIRINLPAGDYTPEFRMLTKGIDARSGGYLRASRKWLAITLVAAGMLAALAGLIFWLTTRTSSNALDKFWSPILNSSERVLICVGAIRGITLPGGIQPASPDSPTDLTATLSARAGAYADSMALSRITGLMIAMKKQFQVRLFSDVKLEDFKSGPVILIGAVNNQWGTRVLSELRFHFQTDGQMAWISDGLNPGKRICSTSRASNPENSVEGCAIISRISDPTIGKDIVNIAGMSAPATSAAAEALSERTFMEKIAADAPKSWNRKNIQILISMRLDGNSYGPPKVEAIHFW